MRNLRNLTDELGEARALSRELDRLASVTPDDEQLQQDAAQAEALVKYLESAVATARSLAIKGWGNATSADIGAARKALR